MSEIGFMCKNGFFRIVWGDPWNKPAGGGGDVCLDLILLQHNEFEKNARVPILVYGEENFKRLSDMGFLCFLIEKKNSVLPPERTLLHKLLAWEFGMGIFDNAICLDIDCHQVSELPNDFWSIHEKKSILQIPLISYRRRYVMWRMTNKEIVPCCCYVYFRGREPTKMAFKALENLKSDPDVGEWFTDETVMARVIEDMDGGWHGTEEYAKLHEPDFFSTGKIAGIPGPQPPYFKHYLRQNLVMRQIKKDGIKISAKQAKILGIPPL